MLGQGWDKSFLAPGSCSSPLLSCREIFSGKTIELQLLPRSSKGKWKKAGSSKGRGNKARSNKERWNKAGSSKERGNKAGRNKERGNKAGSSKERWKKAGSSKKRGNKAAPSGPKYPQARPRAQTRAVLGGGMAGAQRGARRHQGAPGSTGGGAEGSGGTLVAAGFGSREAQPSPLTLQTRLHFSRIAQREEKRNHFKRQTRALQAPSSLARRGHRVPTSPSTLGQSQPCLGRGCHAKTPHF